MKIKVDFISGVLLLLSSIISLLLPIFKITNTLFVLKLLLLTTAIINLGRFICSYKTKDFEGLYTCLTSFFLFVFLFYIKNISSLSYALLTFIFVIFQSFIRLKKADYYHDRKDKIWMLEITTLIVFIISGILTSLNLLMFTESSETIIGFLFFINGFIELIDPIINYIQN